MTQVISGVTFPDMLLFFEISYVLKEGKNRLLKN